MSRARFQRNKLHWFAAVAAVLIILGPGIFERFVKARCDPEYNGKRLSEYLLRIFVFPPTPAHYARLRARGESNDRANGEAILALRALGSRATPLLSNWVMTPEPAYRKRIRAICEKRDWPCPRSFQERQSLAL